MNLPGEATALLGEADRLLRESARRGLVLRLAGSAAVLRHCEACRAAAAALGREPPQDLDFFAYAKQQREIGRMFADLGYQADPAVAFSQEYGIDRLIYLGHDTAAKIDVFLDALRMSHTIEFRNRLGNDGPTAQAADLLLTKLQIRQITEKDIKDMAALLASHALGDVSDGSIEKRRITALMANDWGLHHTARANLTTAETLLAGWGSAGQVTAAALTRIKQLQNSIEQAPKSLRWKARAKLGTRVRWYQEVGDAEQQGQGGAGVWER